jgi:hypothetical protein
MGNWLFTGYNFINPLSKEKIQSYIFPAPREEGDLQYFIDNYRHIKLVTVDYGSE